LARRQIRTPDIGGKSSTTEMGKAIASLVGKSGASAGE
jgi:isocitrate/isopropylmalate dehydrogenase